MASERESRQRRVARLLSRTRMAQSPSESAVVCTEYPISLQEARREVRSRGKPRACCGRHKAVCSSDVRVSHSDFPLFPLSAAARLEQCHAAQCIAVQKPACTKSCCQELRAVQGEQQTADGVEPKYARGILSASWSWTCTRLGTDPRVWSTRATVASKEKPHGDSAVMALATRHSRTGSKSTSRAGSVPDSPKHPLSGQVLSPDPPVWRMQGASRCSRTVELRCVPQESARSNFFF